MRLSCQLTLTIELTPCPIRRRKFLLLPLPLCMVHVEISEEAIELLEKRGYDPRYDGLNRAGGDAPLLGLVLEAIDVTP